MSFFASFWKAVTQPVVNLFQSSANTIGTIGDVSDDVVTAIGGVTKAIVAPIPVLNTLVSEVVDDFVYQNDLLNTLNENVAQFAADIVELDQVIGVDWLDPNIDLGDYTWAQYDTYVSDIVDNTFDAIGNSLENIFSFG